MAQKQKKSFLSIRQRGQSNRRTCFVPIWIIFNFSRSTCMNFLLTNEKARPRCFSILDVLYLYVRHALTCSVFWASVKWLYGLIEALYIASCISFPSIAILMRAYRSFQSSTAWVSTTIFYSINSFSLALWRLSSSMCY